MKLLGFQRKQGGAAELIKDNFDGLLCEISNPNDMALKIECLIKDENLRSNLV
ncbi:glycosyltransferase, partial [Campylobacter ureolyticus]